MRILANMIFLLLALLVVSGCKDNKQKITSSGNSVEKYTCPMHPQIHQGHPGTCPICKMDLVLLRQDNADNRAVELSAQQISLANIKTIRVAEAAFSTSKVLNGRLVSNVGATEVIASRYPGRIEKLYVKEAGIHVSKGQPLFQVYSEQLQALQQDYLLQIKQSAAFPTEKIYRQLGEAAKNKLLLFGVSNAQIGALEKSGKVSASVVVSSAVSGVVREINITEGQYIAEGSGVFSIEDYGSLWLEVDVYPSDAARVKPGTKLKVAINGTGRELNLKADFVAPQLNSATQILTVRATVPNPAGDLQPGMQATVFLQGGQQRNGISVPLDAVIRNGAGTHVWLKKTDKTFIPRPVTTGMEDDDQIVITSGLAASDEVVVSGTYLLYSEFVLKKGAEPISAHID